MSEQLTQWPSAHRRSHVPTFKERLFQHGAASDVLPRIFVDQSFTARSTLQTGVHRVVRNVARYLPTLFDGYVQPVFAAPGGFRPIDVLRGSYIQRRLNDYETRMLDNIPSPLVSVSKLFCRRIRHKRVQSWLLPAPGHLGVYRYPLRVVQSVHRLSSRKPTIQYIGKGDILLLADAYWATPNFWPVVSEAKRNGAHICSVVYDLIPMDYPELVVEGASQSFKDYLIKIGRLSDQIVAISQTVRKQVEEVLPRLIDGSHCQRFDSFELGADAFDGSKQKPSAHVERIFKGEESNRPYLMVATFEPRKNHRYVLEAFEHIWRLHPERKLCLVGRVGWKCDELLKSIKEHPRLGSQLFVFHELNDSEVEFCYQNAKAVLFPSIAEGFGLPIAEALSRGCFVFASDTEIHREVGAENCFYSNLNDCRDLAEQIISWESRQTNELPRRVSLCRPRNWRESINELLLHTLAGWQAQQLGPRSRTSQARRLADS